jgi:hypothetical protein
MEILRKLQIKSSKENSGQKKIEKLQELQNSKVLIEGFDTN